jgi:RNA polymerase sigma factor (sigma-70 family)
LSDALVVVMRHEYGRVVAALLREFGGAGVARIEDALSQAMVEALTSWASRGPPASPRAWLHRAARHRLLDELRSARRFEALGTHEESARDDDPGLSDDIHDDELRALYACAAPSIPPPSQLVFALRTLAGFSTREIAARLCTTEENVQKRFERAREAFRDIDVCEALSGEALRERSEAVLRMLYVMFTEGYFASASETPLRLELCQEAIRLATLVSRHAQLSSSDALALVALMHFHHARRDARIDAEGKPVLLEVQNRSRYRHDELTVALKLLTQASTTETGEVQLSGRWQIEAAIAAEHACAPDFESTRWSVVLQLYQRLMVVEPSPLHALHAAIAASYAINPEAGLAQLKAMQPPTWLLGSHLWLATLADLTARAGNLPVARGYYDQAIALAPPNEKEVLKLRRDARVK